MYGVTIRLEQFRGQLQWVARDDQEEWRAYCPASHESTAMFHSDELLDVVNHGDHTTAYVITE
jgi:hypothetical protein